MQRKNSKMKEKIIVKKLRLSFEAEASEIVYDEIDCTKYGDMKSSVKDGV